MWTRLHECGVRGEVVVTPQIAASFEGTQARRPMFSSLRVGRDTVRE